MRKPNARLALIALAIGAIVVVAVRATTTGHSLPEKAAPRPSSSPPPAPTGWRAAPECAGLRGALGGEPPAGPGRTVGCPALAVVRESLALRTDPDAAQLQALRAQVEAAIGTHPVDCAEALGRELLTASACDLVFDAVAIRVMTREAVPPRRRAWLLEQPSSCRWKLVAALRESTSADPTVLATVLDLTQESDADVRNGAWLTVGTLGLAARRAAQNETRQCVEATLAAELESSEATERFPIVLGAAGNAGCERCRPALTRLLSGDNESLRRRAASAHRFLDAETDVDALCRVARLDGSEGVRGTASVALRHGTSFLEKRVECLYDVAVDDAVERVALEAVDSVAELASGREAVVGAVVEIARETRHPKVWDRAIDALRAVASDDAIRDALSAPSHR